MTPQELIFLYTFKADTIRHIMNYYIEEGKPIPRKDVIEVMTNYLVPLGVLAALTGEDPEEDPSSDFLWDLSQLSEEEIMFDDFQSIFKEASEMVQSTLKTKLLCDQH